MQQPILFKAFLKVVTLDRGKVKVVEDFAGGERA
jgi:hypothetical protein